MRNYHVVLEQLNESERRFIKLENDRNRLHDTTDNLVVELNDKKWQLDNRISVDYYLFSAIGALVNILEYLRAVVVGLVRAMFGDGDQGHQRGDRGRKH